MDSISMDSNVLAPKVKNRYSSKRRKKLWFFFLMSLPFLIQVAIFYFYINGSSIIMSFFKYSYIKDSSGGVLGIERFWAGFSNFGDVFEVIFSAKEAGMFLVSFVMYAFILVVITPIVIFFSFYIYKRYFMSEFFRVILYMPQIISSVVWVALYKMLIDEVLKSITGAPTKVFDPANMDTLKLTVAMVGFIFWTGFGGNILLMSGAMSGIDESVVEACHLDGCNTTREFMHITLPSIYPTITTFIVLDITSIFTQTMHLFTFFGGSSPIKSVGYFMEINTLFTAGLTSVSGKQDYLFYPQLSAMGLLITIVTVPLAIGVRKMMEKLGPSED